MLSPSTERAISISVAHSTIGYEQIMRLRFERIDCQQIREAMAQFGQPVDAQREPVFVMRANRS